MFCSGMVRGKETAYQANMKKVPRYTHWDTHTHKHTQAQTQTQTQTQTFTDTQTQTHRHTT